MQFLIRKFSTYHSRPIVIASASTFAALIIVVFIIIPSQREIHGLNNRIRDQRKALEYLFAQGQNFRITAKEYDLVKKDIPLIDSSFFVLGRELEAITVFETIASDAGVNQVITLDTAQQVPVKNGAPPSYRRVIMRLDIVGTFSQMVDVLKKIESLPQYVSVITFSANSSFRSLPPLKGVLQEPTTRSEGTQLRFNIQAATYWLDPSIHPVATNPASL